MNLVGGGHLDTLTMEFYAAQLVDANAEAAIERHLIYCEECRARMAAAGTRDDLLGVEPIRLQRIWDGVLQVIEAPSRSMLTLAGLRVRSEWRRLRHFLALSLRSARRSAPVARRAVVCALALLTVPLLIIISVSRSAPDPFDRVDDSGHRSQTFGAARALARLSGSDIDTAGTVDTVGALGTVGTAGTGVPCAGGDPGCPAGESAAVPQHLCAAPDLAFDVLWTTARPGQGTLRVTNVSGTVCLLPTVIQVEPMASADDPGPVQESHRPLSAYQVYHLYPSRPAESALTWLPRCGPSTAVTISVGWGNGSTDVTGTVPDLPICAPGAGQPALTAGQLRPAFVSSAESQAL